MSNELLDQLSRPFPPGRVEWKPGATKGDKCMALAFADLRAYMERLDDVCGLDWAVEYLPWGDSRIIARLTIAGVTRASTGEMSKSEMSGDNGGTTAEAQAFKRAATMFGLGRSIYDLPSPWIEFDPSSKRITPTALAQLEARYSAWYAKTMAAAKRTLPAQEPVRVVDTTTGEIAGGSLSEGDVLFGRDDDGAPTEVELTIVGDWRTRKDAEMWAIMVGACENEHEARNSLDKVVAKHGGKVTLDNFNAIYLDFVRRQHEKLAELAQTLAAQASLVQSTDAKPKTNTRAAKAQQPVAANGKPVSVPA